MEKTKLLEEVFKTSKPIIGMIHSKGSTPIEIMEIAKEKIEVIPVNGIDAALIENCYNGDISSIREVLDYIYNKRQKDSDFNLIFGINVIGDMRTLFTLDRLYNPSFIQIDSVAGHFGGEEDELFAERLAFYRENSKSFILGGVHSKYYPILSKRTLEEDLIIAMERCDAIVLTNEGTMTNLHRLREYRSIIGDFPLFVRNDSMTDNFLEQLAIADGEIINIQDSIDQVKILKK